MGFEGIELSAYEYKALVKKAVQLDVITGIVVSEAKEDKYMSTRVKAILSILGIELEVDD